MKCMHLGTNHHLTNGIEEFLPEPVGFEERPHSDSSFDSEDGVDKPLTRATKATTTSTPDDLTTTPTEEFEYEIVEVEVDENGNEIVSEKGDSAEKSTITTTPQISRQKDIGDADKQNNEEEQRESEQRRRKRPDAIETSLEVKVEEEQKQQRRLGDAEKQSADAVREQEERKKLVEAQKRALNLPADTEVEYVDGDTTTTPEENEAEYAEKEAER
ncbi:hypothetical protein ANCCAN_11202 [Ancylostoma caninum]|uniref:Uncharacterized protein n=1 Tax=Ancylostoma caninum TaxID=29170 RepID=A0A368GEJ3_ANCCA|nr:hypothetical protein ANCCAN_11202 [Ancylostoma caninum]